MLDGKRGTGVSRVADLARVVVTPVSSRAVLFINVP
jgi:hypothetical protein